MDWTSLNLSVAMPEIVLLTGLFAVLLADLWTNDKNRYITHALSIIVLLAAVFGQMAVWTTEPIAALSGMYIADGISQLSKIAIYLGTALLFVYAKPYNQNHEIFKGEFYTLALFANAGMGVMISAGHFLSAYVGLELLSLSLYAMIALRREDAQASEAALKYFVLGALASGILLYGISMVYGATGSLNFVQIAAASQAGSVNEWLLKLGVLFIVAAVAFKFGAVPFHMWVADVYQGAPTSVAAFVGSVPKNCGDCIHIPYYGRWFVVPKSGLASDVCSDCDCIIGGRQFGSHYANQLKTNVGVFYGIAHGFCVVGFFGQCHWVGSCNILCDCVCCDEFSWFWCDDAVESSRF